jgi:nitrate reductase NapE component
MGNHLRTLAQRRRTVAVKVMFVVVLACAFIGAYDFLVNHPDAWSHKPPGLDEGMAIMSVLLVPITLVLYSIKTVFRKKGKRRKEPKKEPKAHLVTS